MRSLLMRTSGTLMFIVITFGALAQDNKKPDSGSDASAVMARPALTGKERLGPKWQDEQRIDNCHVPVDKRGNKPRPSSCPHDPSS